jgi:shikimate kinase
MTGRHLVLVGLMGAGKSTVGARCAKRMGRPFIDTDDLVQTTAGMTIPDVFALYGEGRFRALVHADNRRVLKSAGVVVWLQAPPGVLADRVGHGSARAERPLLAGGPAATLERLADVRASAYEAVANIVVDTSGRTVDEVVDVVLDAYEGYADA